MNPPFELTHTQLVSAVQDYCEKFITGYARMTYEEQRLEAKHQLDLFAMRCVRLPII